MINTQNIPQRKNVVKYQTQTITEPVIIDPPKRIKRIISNSHYVTGEEVLLIVRDVDTSEVTLDSTKNDEITIKSLTTVLVKADIGLIDQEWDELLLEKGACVHFQFLEGNWYILSSDGLKMS
jgi:hypothetical protein